jgi:hypothetical protein
MPAMPQIAFPAITPIAPIAPIAAIAPAGSPTPFGAPMAPQISAPGYGYGQPQAQPQTQGQPQAQPEPQAQAQEPAQAPRPAAEHHGVARLVADALSKVTIPEDKQAEIRQVVSAMDNDLAAVSEARKALISALADQLESGSIDRCALEPKVNALIEAREHAAPAIEHEFSNLHALLDSCQRGEFADALSARLGEHAEKFKSGAWLDDLASELCLSADQRKEIEHAVKEFGSAIRSEHGEHARLIQAFRGDSFCPEKVVSPAEVDESIKAQAERVVALTEALNHVLTPEQRSKAAERMREKAQR